MLLGNRGCLLGTLQGSSSVTQRSQEHDLESLGLRGQAETKQLACFGEKTLLVWRFLSDEGNRVMGLQNGHFNEMSELMLESSGALSPNVCDKEPFPADDSELDGVSSSYCNDFQVDPGQRPRFLLVVMDINSNWYT
ncbi:hypothetical protein EJB05_35674, partial [Eragrostis curvula]